jgi:photosynthetic reaction center cytochrome c subunit
MLRERPDPTRLSPQVSYYVVYAAVAGFMALGSIALVWWIVYTLRAQEAALVAASPVDPTVYVNYDIRGDYSQTQAWADAQAAYQTWQAANPQPRNVKILTGWSTAQIYGYMVNQVSGGLKVSCQHCHNIQDYSSYNNPNKVRALGMMQMVKDLNENWITLLPATAGNNPIKNQVSCATCHNGQNAGWDNYPAEVTNLIPASFRIPLDKQYPGVLTVTGNTEKSLEDVAANQYTMYHMNASLGQGCTFCHNARYFPSNEIAQKEYSTHMLNMIRYLQNEGAATLNIEGVDVAQLLAIPGAPNNQYSYYQLMREKNQSCWMCHRGARVPGGSVNEGQAAPQLDIVK